MPAPATSLIEALHALGPAAEHREKYGLYAWLIGQWEMDATYVLADGKTRRDRGEIHFGWVLEGRAIQDVWIMPARGQPRDGPPAWGDFYGATLRVYDPALDAWHILWIDPLTQTYRRMIGRARGQDIVQEGEDEHGAPVRWSFTEITDNSFRWLAERSTDGGATWQCLVQFLARRTGI